MSDGSLPSLKPVIARLAEGEALSEAEAEAAFDTLMAGEATPAQIAGLLMALRVRGETVDEITGAARVMRARMSAIAAPAGAIDVCGTGGDAQGTVNISTTVAFVVAGCGVAVAKHGNRAISSRSGGADVLGALGVTIDAPFPVLEEALKQVRVAFLMAPRHHAAMRHVAGPRVELGVRTIFNVLGPLANPARVKRQLVGVFGRKWLRPLAETLGRLGAERAWVVHGSDGLDELTVTGESHVAEWHEGRVREFTVKPADAGLKLASPAALKGGDAAENAEALRAVLGGIAGPYRDAVLLNAAAALIIAGRAGDLKEGVALAAKSIDSGAARAALDALIAITRSEGRA
ncbi:anthranilate phosphoribosyltransferase [Elioraea tepidiphila]|jgi:anthranilate phosphoribosyltransferase|uniref:anthranilate phosphoribosyltransferase n=1 Tax=Elioraea tepidiphila TaxID=457934 RepID=UPI00037DD304|nr:anthranilate phosphoribosyltransferase [Elioraea tepidiphila]